MEVFNGRPREKRTDVEEACYDRLEELNIPFSRVDHDPAETIEKCRAIEEALAAPVCKNLLLCNRQQTAFYLLLLPGDKVFKTKDLSSQIGSARLSFASGEQMESLLSTSPGSLSLLSLLFDPDNEVALLLDRDLLAFAEWGMHPCKNTSTLRISKDLLIEKFLPSVRHTPVYVTL